jgi:hypothetical protein
LVLSQIRKSALASAFRKLGEQHPEPLAKNKLFFFGGMDGSTHSSGAAVPGAGGLFTTERTGSNRQVATDS